MGTAELSLKTVMSTVYLFLKFVNEHEKVRDILVVIGAFYSLRLAVKILTSGIFWLVFLGWFLTTQNFLPAKNASTVKEAKKTELVHPRLSRITGTPTKSAIRLGVVRPPLS